MGTMKCAESKATFAVHAGAQRVGALTRFKVYPMQAVEKVESCITRNLFFFISLFSDEIKCLN